MRLIIRYNIIHVETLFIKRFFFYRPYELVHKLIKKCFIFIATLSLNQQFQITPQ